MFLISTINHYRYLDEFDLTKKCELIEHAHSLSSNMRTFDDILQSEDQRINEQKYNDKVLNRYKHFPDDQKAEDEQTKSWIMRSQRQTERMMRNDSLFKQMYLSQARRMRNKLVDALKLRGVQPPYVGFSGRYSAIEANLDDGQLVGAHPVQQISDWIDFLANKLAATDR